MEDDKKEKPFNHVLEVQNGRIDIRDIFKRADERVKEKMKEAQDGKVSS